MSKIADMNFVLLDCDTGTDDAVALMMLLSYKEKATVVGVTCVEGNTDLNNVAMNNLRILKLFDRIDNVPVFKGCPGPLVPLSNPTTSSNVHGEDGMSDKKDVYPPATPGLLDHLQKEHAVDAIIRLSKQYEGELKIVATAPLTNIAMAVRKDPGLPSRLKGLFIMGGTKSCMGNVTPCAEFNFHFDPEAAWIVLNSFPGHCPVHVIDFELTMSVPTPWPWYKKWLADDTNKKQVFTKAILTSLVDIMKSISDKGQVICDAYAMAIALDETVGLQPFDKKVILELGGQHTRGLMALDQFGLCKEAAGPIRMYQTIDFDKYHAMLEHALL